MSKILNSASDSQRSSWKVTTPENRDRKFPHMVFSSFSPSSSSSPSAKPTPDYGTPEEERRRKSGKASTMLTSKESYAAPAVSATKLLGG